MRRHAGDRRCLEKIRGVLHSALKTFDRLVHFHGQIKTRLAEIQFEWKPCDVRAGRIGQGHIELNEHRLNQRLIAGVAFWLQLFDEPLEWNILMFVSLDGDLPHAF